MTDGSHGVIIEMLIRRLWLLASTYHKTKGAEMGDIYSVGGDEGRRLAKAAAEKGWRLDYLRRTFPCVPAGIVKAQLYKGDVGGPFFFWVSSESDVATVLREVTDYLTLPSPDDPGIRRAAQIHQYHKENEQSTARALTEIGMVKSDGVWKRRPVLDKQPGMC